MSRSSKKINLRAWVYRGIPVTPRGASQLAVAHGYQDAADLAHGLPKNAKVLDVGAGLSSLGHSVALVRPDVEWTDLDPAYQDRHIRNEARKGAPSNLHLALGDAASILERYGPNTFDAVFSHWMMPHLLSDPESAEQAAANMFEVAKLGGRISVGPVAEVWWDIRQPDPETGGQTVNVIKEPTDMADTFAQHAIMRILPPEYQSRHVATGL